MCHQNVEEVPVFHESHNVLLFSAIIGRNMELFKKHLLKFVYAMPAVSGDRVLRVLDFLLHTRV